MDGGGHGALIQTKTQLFVASLDDLVVHGLRALRDTLQQDKELNINNCSIGIVGKDTKFYAIEGEGLQRLVIVLLCGGSHLRGLTPFCFHRYLDLLADTESSSGGAGGAAAPMEETPAEEGAAPMETD